MLPLDRGARDDGGAAVGFGKNMPEILSRESVDKVSMARASDEDMLRIISRCDRSSLSIEVYPDPFRSWPAR